MKLTKRKNNSKRKSNNKTKKIKGGGIIDFNLLGDFGYCGTIITPNIPFIDSGLITKIASKNDTTTEIYGYGVINKINGGENEYDKMQVKILCNPLPIKYELNQLNKEIYNKISNSSFDYNPLHTDAMLTEKGDMSVESFFNKTATRENVNQVVLNIFIELIPIVESLSVLYENEYIHGDIKMNNIMVKNGKCHLIDLGTFVKRQKFIDDANSETNKLCDKLEHTPIESFFINIDKQLDKEDNNNNISIRNAEYKRIADEKYEKLYSYFIVNEYSTDRTFEYFKNKYEEDIKTTKEMIVSKNENINNFYENVFGKFDVFSFSFSIIKLLKYTNNPSVFTSLYKYLVEYGYTFDLQKRDTITAFSVKYKEIVNNINNIMIMEQNNNRNIGGYAADAIDNNNFNNYINKEKTAAEIAIEIQREIERKYPFMKNVVLDSKDNIMSDEMRKRREDPNWIQNDFKKHMESSRIENEERRKRHELFEKSGKRRSMTVLAYELDTPEKLGEWFRNSQKELKERREKEAAENNNQS